MVKKGDHAPFLRKIPITLNCDEVNAPIYFGILIELYTIVSLGYDNADHVLRKGIHVVR